MASTDRAHARVPEQELRLRLAAERDRLERAAGLGPRPAHYRRPTERPFTREHREAARILFFGLTAKHERLIQAALGGLGHDAEPLPTPDVEAFQVGREYGNNGQCNPNYFTVGSLVKHLQGLEDRGSTRQQLIDRYVMVTAGACGPCRFGMYESEYRLALHNAGFDGFRVALFDKDSGLDQVGRGAGIDFGVDFFLALLNAIVVGDLLNDLSYQIRPFEVVPGETDRVMAECLDRVGEVFGDGPAAPSRWLRRAASAVPGRPGRADQVAAVVAQLRDPRFVRVLGEVRDRLGEVRVDRTRVRPVVKVTGEFWAQTTEGDGNFRMFEFLEREGAQVVVEPMSTWITYLLAQTRQRNLDRRGIGPDRAVRARGDWLGRLVDDVRVRRANAPLGVAERAFVREWERYRKALGGQAHPLADQYELQRMAHPYYNTRAAGGEGHLEVAKNLYYSTHGLCHMVVSLKPFGCMPSTQSDGVQSAVTSHYPDMVYLPVETSGEGEVNAHSRVQMALGDARAKCNAELEQALRDTGLGLDDVREVAAQRPVLTRATYRVPRVPGVAGTAATFTRHVADLVGTG
ncbi:MAG TPA: activator of (R)-2-hydroxyglutaryl-CoA dehydratase [Actinomycetes bacterium]